MKRIITLIFALMGFAVGTTAATVITSVEGTSSPKFVLVPQVGNSVLTYPTVTITKGSPAVIYTKNGEYKGVWQKKNGSKWEDVYSGEFTPGTWRFNCLLSIPDETNSYNLSPSLTVKVDGEKWEVENVVNDEYSSYAYINSPEYVVDSRQFIVEIEATSSPTVSSVPKFGKAMEKPSFTVTKGKPAFFSISETAGWWEQKEGSTWKVADADAFSAGTWRFKAPIGIKNNDALSYKFAPASALNVKVDGAAWSVELVDNQDTYAWAYANSPEYVVEETLSGTLGTQGTWEIDNGVLTIDYNGDMPQDVTLSTTDPEKAYRLVFEPYLKQIQKVVIKGHDVGVQPYLFYFDGDGPDGTHPDDNITEITISSGVKSIGKQAFVVYNLKHFYTYREMPPTLSSDNGGSNVFWQKRITANLTRLHELNKSGVGTNYARTNTEWVKFAVITNDLNQTDDPNYADVVGINDLTPALFQGDGAWYTLDGRRMQGKPAQKGLYIRNGKKVMVK